MKITGKGIPVNDEHVSLEYDVREVSGADAPVAARFDACPEYPGLSLEGVIDLRIHEGRFYSRVPQTVFDGTTMDFGVRWASVAQVEEIVQTGLAALRLIDGELWEPTVEPSLYVPRLGREIHILHSNSTLANNQWVPFSSPNSYRLTQLDEALAHAREIRDGGAQTVPFLEVLIPEVFAPAP
ncbi:hypothetical protein [Arthrobacter sp. IK3]|uniref:hypothetical protein n=1 Tax=Arthrobacter sp. IK3 TaxID=3448169 RepID=UPI003EE170A2